MGRNGSGKSTLLQIICNVVPATSGKVQVDGKVAALLELGTGFNSEFSGRENVYLNGTILGLSRQQIDERFDAIVAFSGIGDFIEQPLKVYSSGMVVRLAFSVMVNVDADIWVIDEALAVGDEAFQRKCYSKISDFVDQGKTLVFVSHGPQTVIELCDRAILIDQGQLIQDGPAKDVIREYHRRLYSPNLKADASCPSRGGELAGSPADQVDAFLDPEMLCQSTLEYAVQGARIRNIRVLNQEGRQVNLLSQNMTYTYAYEVEFLEDAIKVVFGSMLKTLTGIELGGILSHPVSKPIAHISSGSQAEIRFYFHCCLSPGVYFMNAGVTGDRNGLNGYLHRVVDAVMFRVQPSADSQFTGLIDFTNQQIPEVKITDPN